MKKKARIYIRVTYEEKREFKRQAKAAGVTLTEWLMKRVLEDFTMPAKENSHE